MNSVLQALSQSDKLVWSLRSIYRLASSVSDEDSKVVDKHTTFVKRLNYIFMFLRSRWKILSRSEMIQEKESSDTNLIYDPQAFRKLFATEFSPQFAGNSQQDAHEYLTALIQQIDSSCKAIQSLSKNSCSVEKENKSTTRNLGLPCQSSLHFKMETEFECTNVFCKFKRCVVEDFFSLSLDLPLEESAEKLDIRKLMSSFSGKRERDLRCEKCKNNRVFSKTQFSSAPNILIVHLKRFSFDSERQTSSKRTDIVSVPKSLDISEFSGSARTPFRLFAIVNHFGDRAQSGHYLCDLSTSSNLWSRRNDSTESTIEENTALETASRSGYLLFYTKSNSS